MQDAQRLTLFVHHHQGGNFYIFHDLQAFGGQGIVPNGFWVGGHQAADRCVGQAHPLADTAPQIAIGVYADQNAFSSTTVVMPNPLSVISSSAWARGASVRTRGMASPVCMISVTSRSSLRPKVPPGWEKAKSSAVNPRASSKAMASASPMTSEAVVLAVGARARGQASLATLMSRLASDISARGERAFPVMLMMGMPRRFIRGSKLTISSELPE